MKVSQYLVTKLIEYGVTDAFGIPGNVILDMIYEMDINPKINVHLNYHEQAAGYAACGYAQTTGKMGVAYATKGPGFTNMITPFAEAYYDSLPVLFITAHSQKQLNKEVRIEEEQEIEHCNYVSNICKYAKRIDDIENVEKAIETACKEAVSARKGPVLLDFSAKLLTQEMKEKKKTNIEKKEESYQIEFLGEIKNCIEAAMRPIILIGDGIRHTNTEDIYSFAKGNNIPIISSRFSQDIFCGRELYFGYIGSHGLRYSNFILSKADCIIALGNRMSFQLQSQSFRPIVDNCKIIWVDIDQNELKRKMPNTYSACMDVNDFIVEIHNARLECDRGKKWVNICRVLKNELSECDMNEITMSLNSIILKLDNNGTIICDIGNNELLVSRAYAYAEKKIRLLHSKTFKTVGSAIGKAIGSHYASKESVLCIVGDQGLQFNLQELELISINRLPITILIINNNESEMLKNSEKAQGYAYNLHTTFESGYGHPNFEKIAEAYSMNYIRVKNIDLIENIRFDKNPQIIELVIDGKNVTFPVLPKGNPCQMFVPEIETSKYEYLDNL